MVLLRDILIHAFWTALELQLHGLTPLTLVSALTFGNITLLFLTAGNLHFATAYEPKQNLQDVAVLWAMGSISILIWVACVILLHNAGLL